MTKGKYLKVGDSIKVWWSSKQKLVGAPANVDQIVEFGCSPALDFEIDNSDIRNPLTKEIASSHFNKIATKKIIGA